MKPPAYRSPDAAGWRGGDFTKFVSLKKTGSSISPGAKSLSS
jgi:hypothetical protein